MSQDRSETCPVRSYMDDTGIAWRFGKAPNFSLVNENYLKGRTKHHKADSLEKLVENIVKTFEMEASHKTDLADWGTIDKDKFRLRSNGSDWYSAQEVVDLGTYQVFLMQCPMYRAKEETNESSQHLFKGCFPGGFMWELLEIFSGPPRLCFSWRHWTKWEGPYKGHEPTGETIELMGVAIANVNQQHKLEELEFYFDPMPMMMTLTKGKPPA